MLLTTQICKKKKKRTVPLLSPETPKVNFKARKVPPEKWPQKSIKMSKKSIYGHFKSPKLHFWDILLEFGAIFPGALKWHFSDFKIHFWGFGFRGSVGGPGVCKHRYQEPLN